MPREIILPIKWEDWDAITNDSRLFYNVEFLEDFGIIPKGKYKSTAVFYDDGFIEVYEGEDVIFVQHFKCFPTNG